ncbi:MAG: hypothetical protein IPL58_14020 [Betaproteobacteria bacterium]|uniref:Uncharacterized protein n=1 Tax=Candidatus Proximibacter danicus TaxID=2954365 RepID=A0A9D7K3Z3_9PROT|nr:hypothetical protein [Candidatus Proximibacter danicus]
MSLSAATPSQNALEQARQALIGYAATYRDFKAGQMFGYLPCPDSNNDGNAESDCNNPAKWSSAGYRRRTWAYQHCMTPMENASGMPSATSKTIRRMTSCYPQKR